MIIDVLHWYTVNTYNNIPSLSMAKSAETPTYNAVHAKPFTRIHSPPTRYDYKTLKKEASDLVSEV